MFRRFSRLLETLHTVFIWMYLYEISVTNYGRPAALDGLPWHVDVSLMLQGFVGSAVQAFFSYRAWIVSGKIWLAIPGWIGELVRAGVSIALTVVTLTTPGLTVFREKYEWMGIFTVSVTSLFSSSPSTHSRHPVRACCRD
jgi:hypothetical protein